MIGYLAIFYYLHKKGTMPPEKKVKAETTLACNGFANELIFIPSSSLAWIFTTSSILSVVNCCATSVANSGVKPFSIYISRNSSNSFCLC